LDDKVLTDLEFDAILQQLLAHASTPIGAARIATLRPATEPAEVAIEQALTIEGIRHLESHGALPFGTLADPLPALARLTVEASVCTPTTVLELLQLMRAARDVKSALAMVRAQPLSGG